MRQCSRAIVIKDNNILLMKRLKMGKEYYTLLGGEIKMNETPEAAAIREVREESSLEITNPRLVFVEEAGDPYGVQNIYLCEYSSGEPGLPKDSEEAYWSVESKNTYQPLWFPFNRLEEVPFMSPLLSEAIVKARENGFPEQPFYFSSRHAKRLS